MLGLPDPCLGWATLLRPNFPHERPKLTAHFYGRNDEPIGYWPEGLLRNFTSHATTAVWGGTAVGEDPFPPMGSGHKFTESLEGGYGSACYIRGMKVVEKLGGNFTDVNDGMLTKFENRPICYTVGGSGVMEFLLEGLVDFVDTADYNYFMCSFRCRRILYILFYDMNNNNVCVHDVFIILLSSSLITSVSVLNNQIPKTKPTIH